ncbi:MAG: cytochrome c [Gammaproteobacteria bacterium]
MKSILLTLAVSVALLTASANAGDIAAGKAKSASCIACHGSAGISPTPIWPNLAGQKEQYLVAQLKAFKDGTRANPQMAPMAAGLSDEDMANLAAYYSSLACQ